MSQMQAKNFCKFLHPWVLLTQDYILNMRERERRRKEGKERESEGGREREKREGEKREK